VAAAYLHDLGKMGAYHLTALNVVEYDGHRVAALKTYEMPAHLMAAVGLSAETLDAVTSMYERYDGEGFPDGRAGQQIPLGARILAITDTYADLTQNPRNAYRKLLPPAEACEVLVRHRGTIFDPDLVDVFRTTIGGSDVRQKLLDAFELGFGAVRSRPASRQGAAGELRQAGAESARETGAGVSGALAEMSVADLVQLLWQGRKTCALRIEAEDGGGEIHFAEGQVYNARWGGLRGEEAFYEMVTLREGTFRVDPTFKPSLRAITATSEALLLEGMRRLDESGQARA
jgi:hypothetical protein